MDFENKLLRNNGIYTIPEIAKILRLPYPKVNRWISQYWDGMLGKAFKERYSWTIEGSKAVSFHTLVELYVLMQFSETGVKTDQILKAHMALSQHFQTAFPFANKDILNDLNSDGKRIFLKHNESLLSLDGSLQFNIHYIENFFLNLDFDSEILAQRYWPLGREKSVLVDPRRKFGQPILADSNISPEVLTNMHKAGDSVSFLASIYEISEKEVQDAILFCQAA